MIYGKWWFSRRLTALIILGLFLVSAWGEYDILVGNYSGSMFLGFIPLTDPLMALQSFFATGWLHKTAVIGAFVILGIYLVFGGRAFCGWVCPLGLVLDFANWLSSKLHVNKPFQGFLSGTKYYVMVIVLLVPLITGVAVYEFYNPISILHRAILFSGMGIGIVSWLVVGTLFLYEFAIARMGWCRGLCPLGAFYSILGRFSLIRVDADESRGAIPRNIGEVCPEPRALVNILNHQPPNGECTMCGACIDRVGNGAIFFENKLFKKQKED